MRIAVIGLGGVGVQAAWRLAEAGHEVVGFEQFHLDHALGSSFGASRIIRRAYPDPFYAELMGRAYSLWEELERESGGALLLRCGGLFFGPEGHEEMAATESALRDVGVAFERLSAAQAAAQVPPIRLRPEEYALHDPQSGLLRASRCVRAAADLARARGAELREGQRVLTLVPSRGGVRVVTVSGSLLCDRAIVTVGPWTAGLLSPWVRLPLRVTRQQYAHFGVKGDRAAFGPDRFPVWIDMAEYYYGFPEHDGVEGVKVALHKPGPAQDSGDLDRMPREEENAALLRYLERRIPDAAGPVLSATVCLYTLTPDEDFVVDRLPGEDRVVLVGGLSGHGFKFTVLLGLLASRLVLGQDPECDLTRFAAARFRETGG